MQITNDKQLKEAQEKLTLLKTDIYNEKKFQSEKSQSRKVGKSRLTHLEKQYSLIQDAIKSYQDTHA